MALPALPRPTANDLVLLLTLTYSAVDIQYEWATFSTCHKPIHQWLLASYALLLTFRVLHTVGTHTTDDEHDGMGGEFLVNLRLKGALPQLMLYLTWLVVTPGFCFWTFAGSMWTWEVWVHTPQCLPPQFLWFSVMWQLVSYFWIIAHLTIGFVALSRERKIRLVEADLRALEDTDTIERWGMISQRHSHTSAALSPKCGLSPAEILGLGGTYTQTQETAGLGMDECPICLAEMKVGDSLRQLPNCVHAFHRSCVDLWLLQSASCPLCKEPVKGPDTEASSMKDGSFSV